MSAGLVAVITGATGGIGRAVAFRLAQEGYRLVLHARRPAPLLALQAELVEACPAPDPRVAIWPLDVTDAAAVAVAMARTAARDTRLDLCVTCHGAPPVVGPSLDLAPEDLERVWRTDARGTFLCAREAARAMIGRGGGSLVLVTSLHGLQTYPQRLPYAAAKADVMGMARALAVEWGPLGVRVNAVAPWQVATPRTQRFVDEAEARGEDLGAQYRARSPLRRLIRPEEVADAVLFLARNGGMTGQTLVLDAGVSASMWYRSFLEPGTGESG